MTSYHMAYFYIEHLLPLSTSIILNIHNRMAKLPSDVSKITSPQKLGPESFKASFDISNFDLNAIIRGIQLTLVGGKDALTLKCQLRSARHLCPHLLKSQLIELYKIRPSSQTHIISRLLPLWLLVY